MNDEEFFAMDFENDENGFIRQETDRLMPPTLEVYLAGPLTNNDALVQADCERVREIIKRLLHSYDYLGVRFRVYDPAEITRPGSSHSDEEVYEMDHDRTMSADLVIFHVNAPSLGVGSESQIAADATVPRVTISKTDAKVSRMFKGIFSPSIVDFSYKDCPDLELQLSRNLGRIAMKTIQSAVMRRELMSQFKQLNLGMQILSQRIIYQIPIAKLAELTDIKESWLRRLERNPVLAMCVSAIQLTRIAEALKCHVKIVNGQIPQLSPHPSSLDQEQKESLDNLVGCALTSKTWIKDDEIFRVWTL